MTSISLPAATEGVSEATETPAGGSAWNSKERMISGGPQNPAELRAGAVGAGTLDTVRMRMMSLTGVEGTTMRKMTIEAGVARIESRRKLRKNSGSEMPPSDASNNLRNN